MFAKVSEGFSPFLGNKSGCFWSGIYWAVIKPFFSTVSVSHYTSVFNCPTISPVHVEDSLCTTLEMGLDLKVERKTSCGSGGGSVYTEEEGLLGQCH